MPERKNSNIEYKEFIKRLKDKRLSVGKKQKDLSIDVGLLQSAISKIENNKQELTVKDLLKIGNILKSNISELFIPDKSSLPIFEEPVQKYKKESSIFELFTEKLLQMEKQINILQQEIEKLKADKEKS